MNNEIENLIQNSKLPGKRANLELLYTFANSATDQEVELCYKYKYSDLNNTPEEFIVMCGVLGYCVLNKSNPQNALDRIEEYAISSSWRVREAVAMGIQELALNDSKVLIETLDQWSMGNEKVKRAIIAGLCEPKVLKNKYILENTFRYLRQFTDELSLCSVKLTEEQKILRKALGYAWSVAIVENESIGTSLFETLINNDNKNIRWIVKNNLKKKRLEKMNADWVKNMIGIIAN